MLLKKLQESIMVDLDKVKPQEEEKDEVYILAKNKVVVVKQQIDTLIDQFFEEKMEKVKENEQMIVSSMYEPKLKIAK
jgi:hypothetical protein